MRICSVEGCSEPHKARGYCLNHYMKAKRTGSPDGRPRVITPSMQRAMAFIAKTDDGCWNWTGGLVRGYGRIGLGGRKAGQMQAHRFLYEQFNGPIPDGMVVMHKCDNTRCVNPEHLALGTQSDNMADMRSKGRGQSVGPKGERSALAKLTEDQVREIRGAIDGPVAVARRYGIHRDTVRLIRQRKIWSHID